MLSPYNMLLPSSGEPVTTPTLDMVLGCYYPTIMKPGARGEGRLFSSFNEAKLAYELGIIELGAEVVVRDPSLRSDGGRINTTVGRIIFNDALLPQLRFRNKTADKASLRALVSDCIALLGNEGAAGVLDRLKGLGFQYATKSGISIAMNDIEEPPGRVRLLEESDEKVSLIEDQFNRGSRGAWPWRWSPLPCWCPSCSSGRGSILDAPSAQPEPSRPYILVVPFGVSENATEYHRTFADLVTREVVDNLRKISGLRTVPHASAFHFRSDKTREHVLESLPGLQFVLDGEVSVAPDGTLRITPRLTDLRRDLDVWSSPFTVRVDNRDFFETPAGIAKAVARALKVEILGDKQRALAELPRIPQAYEPYAAGWREVEKFTHESMHRAVEYFDQAIALGPDFIAAYQAKSDALRSIFAYFEPPQELLPVVEAALAAVLERDPDSAEALSSLGLTQVMAWKWREAWQNLNKARALDPTLLMFLLIKADVLKPAESQQFQNRFIRCIM